MDRPGFVAALVLLHFLSPMNM
uniref:Uncharacterized protein DKFZp434E079 n=1 Tax=Homo sapiens TaxID=9606 RepID=Q5HCH6_HUMAN|nr:hypothetical protein [Homo sapiens]